MMVLWLARVMKSVTSSRGATMLGGTSMNSSTGMNEPRNTFSLAMSPAICLNGVTCPILLAQCVARQPFRARSICHFFRPIKTPGDRYFLLDFLLFAPGCRAYAPPGSGPVSYTHLTLPTNREV